MWTELVLIGVGIIAYSSYVVYRDNKELQSARAAAMEHLLRGGSSVEDGMHWDTQTSQVVAEDLIGEVKRRGISLAIGPRKGLRVYSGSLVRLYRTDRGRFFLGVAHSAGFEIIPISIDQANRLYSWFPTRRMTKAEAFSMTQQA